MSEEESKTLGEWEVDHNILFIDRSAYPADGTYTVTEVRDLMRANPNAYKLVNHADRIAWLESKGHQVTHQNMLEDPADGTKSI